MDSTTRKRSSEIGSRQAFVLELIVIYSLLVQAGICSALDTGSCVSPLGMESYEIPDSDITASSSFDAGNVGPQNARVRLEKLGGAWCPKNQVTSEAEEWLQVDLHTIQVITAAETQGRFGNGQGQEYTEKYIVSYWRPELGKWVRYRDAGGNEILKANINTYLAVKTELNPPIIASKLRFLPYSLHRRTVCMRVEIYGCPYRDGLISYTMPQGSKRGDSWNFYDHTYDGLWEGNLLKNGLGALVDGRGGPDNFKDDYYGHERGKGWVGWKNDSRAGNSPVEIIFKFDGVREFSGVHIHSSNQFTKDVKIFSEAKVFFSIGGRQYSEHPVTFVTMEDCIFEGPKNISIKLLHRVGAYVKIELYWAAKWIMISEITFESRPIVGNFTDESVEMIHGPVTTAAPTPTAEDNTNPNPNPNPNILQAQSDASEIFTNGGKRAAAAAAGHSHHHHDGGSNVIGHHHQPTATTTTQAHEWSTATIVMTAVISSFVAILMVLLFILTALVLRNKLNPNGLKMGPSSLSSSSNNTTPHHQHHLMNSGTLAYDTHCTQVIGGGGEFGNGSGCYAVVTPGELRKCKTSGGTRPEYQEPFLSPKPGTKSAMGTMSAAFPGANQTIVAATMKGKMVEYYSCTLVPNNNIMGQPGMGLGNNIDSTNEYEYAVPNELGKLLPSQHPQQVSPHKTIPSSPAFATRNRAIQQKFRELGICEIPKHRLRMLRKLGDGAFGTVFIGEVENNKNEKNLVAVKHLLKNATEKDKSDFLEEIRLLASLNDPNVAQVLGVCTEDEPYSVILEFLELGDLCQFLRQNDTLLPTPNNKKLSSSGLIYLASQIASGMRFLEGRNIVHRDLATRNCVVGHGLLVKISHFATDTDLYASDYYRLDGKMPLPIRWMAWESLFLGKYSTKSDVWSFGITMWEILSYARHSPYPTMTNQEVLNNLRKLSICSEDDQFEPLPKPVGCPRDIYQLICDTWRRNDDDRPTFWEIHSFLTRKSMSFPVGAGVSTHKNNSGTKTFSVTGASSATAQRPSFPNSLPSSTSTSTTNTTASEQYVI